MKYYIFFKIDAGTNHQRAQLHAGEARSKVPVDWMLESFDSPREPSMYVFSADCMHASSYMFKNKIDKYLVRNSTYSVLSI